MCLIINESMIINDFSRTVEPLLDQTHPKDQPIEPSSSSYQSFQKSMKRLLWRSWISILKIISCCQYINQAFEKAISTCIKIIDNIIKAMNRGEITLAVMADFSKEFDTVDFETLTRKLHKLNLSKSSLKIFASYLSNRHNYVQIDDLVSQRLSVTNGVP